MVYRDYIEQKTNEILSTNVTNMARVKKTDIFTQKYKYEVQGIR